MSQSCRNAHSLPSLAHAYTAALSGGQGEANPNMHGTTLRPSAADTDRVPIFIDARLRALIDRGTQAGLGLLRIP